MRIARLAQAALAWRHDVEQAGITGFPGQPAVYIANGLHLSEDRNVWIIAMKLLTVVLDDLRICSGAVLRYVLAAAVVLATYRLLYHGLEVWEAAEAPAKLMSLLHLGLALYLAVVFSGVEAIFLSALGREIDRPIWKCKGPADALRRFFTPWLIINLSCITLIDIQARLALLGQSEAVLLFEGLILIAHLCALPIGAAIMHWGALEWRELGSALRPLLRFLHLLLLPLALAFFQFALVRLRGVVVAGDGSTMVLTRVVLDIPMILLDVLIFALVWRICMMHRNEPEVESDPFDL